MAYVVPLGDSVNFNLNIYVAPIGDNVNFDFSDIIDNLKKNRNKTLGFGII